ncbi:hypothetical protein ERC79_02555 [Rhodococcus sp. ABRD24]|uniref:hypothetical protein n=1 Tax=Rhodococcus sp. ABRD24 TaxID=2507582 RepID=UPI00103E460A|nr:hypothetical protein [Rhodococcus sp. ABRD24]QBJ94968.1 hypothetical protein ERC79_02555 [Rhodococcus sp. ABRD24]
MTKLRRVFAGTAATAAVMAGVMVPPAADAQIGGCGTQSVHPSSQRGWAPLDGTAPEFVEGPPGAVDDGSIELSVTDNTQKVDYYQRLLVPLAGATTLGYRVNTSAGGSASYQLKVVGANRTDGSPLGFTSLVWSGIPNGPTPGWVGLTNLENGNWWSTQSIAGATGGQANPVPLSQIKAANPNALIFAYGVNVGTGQGGSTSNVDSLQFGCTNWDFSPDPTPGSLGSLGSSDIVGSLTGIVGSVAGSLGS